MSWVYRRPFDYRPSQRLGHGFRVIAFAAGAMAGTASLDFGQAAALGGTGALATSEALTLTASAIPINANPNAAEGVAPLVFGQSAVLTGAGAMAGAGALDFGGSAAPSSANSYQQFMWAKRRRRDDIPYDYYAWERNRWIIFPYTVSTQTAGIGSVALSGNALLRATGRLAGNASPRFVTSGTANAGGGLTASEALTFGVGTAALLNGASGAITAGQSFEFSASGTLTGVGNVYGPADLSFDGSATWQSLVPPSGNAALDFSASGVLRNISEGAGVVDDMSFSSTDDLRMFFSA